MLKKLLCILIGHQYQPITPWLGDPFRDKKLTRHHVCSRCMNQSLTYVFTFPKEPREDKPGEVVPIRPDDGGAA